MQTFTAPGQSTIFINPKGWIDVAWGETIDKDEYVFIAQHMVNMEVLMGDQGKQPRMLIDFTNLRHITPDATKLAASATSGLASQKIAGFGIAPDFKGVLDSIKTNSKRTDVIREFASRAAAEEWLAQPSSL